MKCFKQLFGSASPSNSEPAATAESAHMQHIASAWDTNVVSHRANDLQANVDVLRMLVLELLREVEALRRTQLEESKANGICPKESLYGKIYRDTALLTHDSTGPTPGIEKLLDLWRARPIFPSLEDSYARYGSEFTGELTEVGMLKRLGFSPAEIDRYIEDAEERMLRT